MDTNNMWQKCPVCDGRGIVPDTISYGSKQCHACNGHGILSVISGLPPVHQKYTTTTSTTSNSINIKVPHPLGSQYELYKDELNSGMFWEWHPELSGEWELDKTRWINKRFPFNKQ